MRLSFVPVVYVQISPQRLLVKNVKTGAWVDELPEVAIGAPPQRKILAVGSQARTEAGSQVVQVLNPFAHPRSLVSDFTAAEQLLKHQLKRVLAKAWLSPAPSVVMHPLGSPAGGFTQVERTAFREMALGAGASTAFVWTGRPLTDSEVLARRPPAAGGGAWE